MRNYDVWGASIEEEPGQDQLPAQWPIPVVKRMGIRFFNAPDDTVWGNSAFKSSRTKENQSLVSPANKKAPGPPSTRTFREKHQAVNGMA